MSAAAGRPQLNSLWYKFPEKPGSHHENLLPTETLLSKSRILPESGRPEDKLEGLFPTQWFCFGLVDS